MQKWLSMGLVVFIILISIGVCFGNEEKNHICFRQVDADKDGMVTFQEFKKVFGDNKAKFDNIDLDMTKNFHMMNITNPSVTGLHRTCRISRAG